ncbi:MAG: penicillin-binding protein 2, partial [Pseudomonadota bacterium]|nr:penicillin-binding protein 2 [Pseudomonadota bacterium]
AVDQQHFLLEKSYARTERDIKFSAEKGEMVDRNGYPLALSLPYFQLAINPMKHQYSVEDVRILASRLGQNFDTLWRKVKQHTQKGSKYVKLADKLNEDQVRSLSKLSWEGLMLEEKRGRYYSLGDAASTVIGYVDHEGKGRLGLEYQFDRYIDGVDGQMSYTQNLLNQVTQIHQYLPPQSGHQLRLTLDQRLQYRAHEILKETVEYHDAEYATAVLLSSKTGEVLAIGNYPSFDPNKPIVSVDHKTKNHAVADLFEPGSIIKPIALAIMMQSIEERPQIIDTHGGDYEYLGRLFHDHRDLGQVRFEDILLKSSNIAMVKLASMLPASVLIKGYQSFGLFSPLFVQLPGETIGRHVTSPGAVDEAAMSYGYGLSVNVLAMARAYNILANHGKDPGVHMVFERHRPSPEQLINKEITDQISQMMLKVTEEGISSHRAKVKGVPVAGKSGTSHLINESGEYDNHYIATFAGFAPSDDPEYVAVVMVYRPKKNGHYGGQVAAPAFAKLMAQAFYYPLGD